MSGEKRKAAGDWIEATILNEKESRGPYLASFSGVTPPVTTTFREYKRKRTDATQPVKDVILQGETDTTDPPDQSQELYRGLKHYGVETELVMYPREPHGFREEKHLLDRLNRILAWYDAHLK